MNKNLLDILQSKEVPIENQQVIDYLQGNLKPEVSQELEQQELEDEMMRDAMDGLREVEDTSRLEMIAREMNQTLQKKLAAQKNKHKEVRKWKDMNWISLSIATVLLIVVICYLVMKYMKKSGLHF